MRKKRYLIAEAYFVESGIVTALGGLGVFLLGMVIMTDGLKSLTGKALRKTLAYYIRSPVSGAVTGAVSTAIIQSSSATTVTAVSFVGAKIITFSQALGIIFGANIGTTITGWMVAIIGLKLKIGTLALPMVLIGVLMNLFLKRRLSAFGLVIAGFGLIFVGLGLLQGGLSVLEGWVTPDRLPGNTFVGRMALVFIGIAITLVTQSSSAGVATALAAVYAGTISFEQAAAMVVGMDVGTTATAALATIGGSTEVRRTGFAHVIYNVLTGLGAFLLIPVYTWVLQSTSSAWFQQNPEIALVGFHTLFNLLGVILVLPFTGLFARLMIWLIPRQETVYTPRLDRTFLQNPDIALNAVQSSLRLLAKVVFRQMRHLLTSGPNEKIDKELNEVNLAIKAVRDYINGIEASHQHESVFQRKLSAIHAIDHLRRLIDRAQDFKIDKHQKQEVWIQDLTQKLDEGIDSALSGLKILEVNGKMADSDSPSEKIWAAFENRAEDDRRQLILQATNGRLDAKSTMDQLDVIRWIRRVSYHVWRISFHLCGGAPNEMLKMDLDPDATPVDSLQSGNNQ